MNLNKINYVLTTFKSLYDLSDINVKISYGNGVNPEADIIIKKSEYPLNDEIKAVWDIWNKTEIPFLFNDSKQKKIIQKNGKKILINHDIIIASFYLLSGYQEYQCKQKDKYSRFAFKESIQSSMAIYNIPVVNYYFDILKTAIELHSGRKILYSDCYKEPVGFISHDIDKCTKGYLEELFYLIKKGKLFTSLKVLDNRIVNKDPWFNFEIISEMEKKLGVKSTFFFLNSMKRYKGITGADYNINDNDIQNIIHDLAKNGHEIGIHLHPKIFSDKKLEETIKSFPCHVKGCRIHFLKFDYHYTLIELENSDLEYDSTLGFAEMPGFRNSFAHPFLIYNHKDDRPTRILEIPLIIMDTTFSNYLHTRNLGIEFKEHFEDLINQVVKFNGIFTLLWHNNYFSNYKYKRFRDLFDILVNDLKKSNFIFKTGIDISRSHFQLSDTSYPGLICID